MPAPSSRAAWSQVSRGAVSARAEHLGDVIARQDSSLEVEAL